MLKIPGIKLLGEVKDRPNDYIEYISLQKALGESFKEPIDLAYWNKYVGYETKGCQVKLRKTFAKVRWLGH
mgnify:CR=1 FL=1